MKITLLCVGKIKEKYLSSGILEFSKRLSRYTNISIKEVSDEKTVEDATEVEIRNIKKIEGNKISEHLIKLRGADSIVISLVIEGEMLTSEELSERLEKFMVLGKSHFIFIIGGSLGLSDDVIRSSDMKLSFSKMTFPHQLVRLILLEQLYRSFRIQRGEPYHK